MLASTGLELHGASWETYFCVFLCVFLGLAVGGVRIKKGIARGVTTAPARVYKLLACVGRAGGLLECLGPLFCVVWFCLVWIVIAPHPGQPRTRGTAGKGEGQHRYGHMHWFCSARRGAHLSVDCLIGYGI